MRNRPSWRRFLKWAGLAACIAIFLIWTGSGWFVVSYSWSGRTLAYNLDLHNGQIVFFTRSYNSNIELPYRTVCWYRNSWRNPPEFHWGLQVCGTPSWGFTLPLWVPFLLAGVTTSMLLYRDRRYPPGHCCKCGYDLTGNVSGLCPECGQATRTGAISC